MTAVHSSIPGMLAALVLTCSSNCGGDSTANLQTSVQSSATSDSEGVCSGVYVPVWVQARVHDVLLPKAGNGHRRHGMVTRSRHDVIMFRVLRQLGMCIYGPLETLSLSSRRFTHAVRLGDGVDGVSFQLEPTDPDPRQSHVELFDFKLELSPWSGGHAGGPGAQSLGRGRASHWLAHRVT